MSTFDQQAFAVSLALLAREEPDRYRESGIHPTPEELAAYHAGELPENKDVEIQLHLATCTECPDLLIDLEDLFEPRYRDLDLSDSWISGAWRDLRIKLGSNQSEKAGFWQRWLRLFSAIPRPAYAMATGVMFFLLAGATVQVSSLRQELAQPMGQIPDIALSTTRSVSERLTPVEFPAGVNRVQLSFRLPKTDSSQSVQAEFLYNEELLWRIPVSPTKGQAQIEISRWSLDPGEYSVKLIAYRGGKKADLGTHHIQIVHS